MPGFEEVTAIYLTFPSKIVCNPEAWTELRLGEAKLAKAFVFSNLFRKIDS